MAVAEIEGKKVIGVYEIEINTSVSYLINNMLNCLMYWRKIKIYVVHNEK